jgi:hypothetical protein
MHEANYDVFAKQSYQNCKGGRDGIINYQEFQLMHQNYPVLLSPVFRLQQIMRKKFMGVRTRRGCAVQCSAVQCSAVQCSAVQCSAVQWLVSPRVGGYRLVASGLVGQWL